MSLTGSTTTSSVQSISRSFPNGTSRVLKRRPASGFIAGVPFPDGTFDDRRAGTGADREARGGGAAAAQRRDRGRPARGQRAGGGRRRPAGGDPRRSRR